MVLSAAQTTAFWETELALPGATRQRLVLEGLADISDLTEIDTENLKQIADNLRRPAGTMIDPADANGARMIPIPPFVFGAKSQLRMNAAIKLLRFYETVGRVHTASNLKWDPVIKSFSQHWKSLTDRKDESTPDTPKITKTLTVIKWTEAFADFLNRVIGTRTIPLSYVIRADATVANIAPPIAANQPYAAEYGSVESELIARASHTHALFRDDNAKVYYYLEEATRTTIYAGSIKPYQKAKDGRGAWKAMVSQYAGEDKWRMELKRQDELLHTYKWKGQANFSLERFVGQHRNAYISMTQCAEHVQFQLPNEQTRVGYLMDAIGCNDAPLQAAMALVRNDPAKMNSFEETASFLLPHCPVAKKRTAGSKRDIANISDLNASDEKGSDKQVRFSGGKSPKRGIGKSGVHFRFYGLEEYKKLSRAQKEELKEYRDNLESNGKGRNLGKSNSTSNPKSPKQVSSTIAAQVAKQVKEKMKAIESEAASEEQLKDYIISLVSAQKTPTKKANVSSANTLPPAATGDAPTAPLVTLQQIIKRLDKK